MTTQPTHATPFWQVQSVFDPDGTGRDFAYTIGLHTRGLPELHLWARPSLGEDPPGDKEQLEAYGVPDGVDVLPGLWSLERAPDGPLRPLAAGDRSAALRLFDELVASLDLGRAAPPGLARPAGPDFGEDQRFGRVTPVVLARAAQLWQADDEPWWSCSTRPAPRGWASR